MVDMAFGKTVGIADEGASPVEVLACTLSGGDKRWPSTPTNPHRVCSFGTLEGNCLRSGGSGIRKAWTDSKVFLEGFKFALAVVNHAKRFLMNVLSISLASNVDEIAPV